MDFYRIGIKESKNEPPTIYPDFVVGRSKDLMVRSRSFYAIWDEKAGLWSTDEYDVQRITDEDLEAFAAEALEKTGQQYNVRYMRSFDSNRWSQFRKFLQNISDNSHPLDENLTFSNTEVKKSDYVSRRLPYPLQPGECAAWNELVSTLYSAEERAKIEWAIGAIVAGDAKRIQKFLVFYGPAGTGKSTILNIVQKLFEGYVTTFEAKALAGNNNAFATEAFRHNPLVAIQHDGDLSRIEDNTKLNSIISHEEMTMNEKYKPSYSSRVNAFLLMGTNQPVKISDAKSGIIRRLIDVHPTGVILPATRYHVLMSQIEFELGAIAHHCLSIYREMGKNYYSGYIPTEMMLQTDIFYNFVEASHDIFKSQDYTTLAQAYSLYKEFCADTGIERALPQYKIREELRNYFEEYKDRDVVDGSQVRSVYRGFKTPRYKSVDTKSHAFSLVLEETGSLLDTVLAAYPAQYATREGIPKAPWARVDTTLASIDSRELHYVKPPEQHIVIDFDLTDDEGRKSAERNLEAASVWPPTYAEYSQGGAGIHLHYDYSGDVSELSNRFGDGIEIKTFLGGGALRRRLTRCNAVPVATLDSGLPIKEKKTMMQDKVIKTERGLRDLIQRNMRKEFHPGTKPSVDFIKAILDEAYENGVSYNVTDLKPSLVAFANNSTNQAGTCIRTVMEMKFASEKPADAVDDASKKDEPLVFFDCEVYPNLFIVCWEAEDSDETVRMINPTPAEIEELMKLKLAGFNCRRYDNHIVYGRHLGYDNMGLFKLSQKLINNDRTAGFGEAYNVSHIDIWEMSSVRMGLKKWEVELGIHHSELDLPWDEDVEEKDIPRIVEYCVNDVKATKAVFLARREDFTAREILAALSGMSMNSTTQQHAAQIIFQGDRDAQSKFVYTDLSKDFPGYTFDAGKSSYRGEDPSEGGYVYAEPGLYENVAVLDVASMHPTSIEMLNAFGPYTANFSALIAARIAIKRGDFEGARKMFNGKLKPFLKDESQAKALAYALKIAINIVYGMTSATFDNPFRDHRNKDNIVAKRGALFMIDLKNYVQSLGYQVIHIKTDSIKIPNADEPIVEQIMDFGRQYGYTFEHEATYDKFALVNDAVYIAQEAGKWTAVGAQFQHPYVFKTLFTHDDVEWADLLEPRSVTKGSMYLDFNYDRPVVAEADTGMHFVGRTGVFVPVTKGSGGGMLWRVHEGKQFAVAGTKNYIWMEADQAKMLLDNGEAIEIDTNYYEAKADEAIKTIEKFGSFESLVAPFVDPVEEIAA